MVYTVFISESKEIHSERLTKDILLKIIRDCVSSSGNSQPSLFKEEKDG